MTTGFSWADVNNLHNYRFSEPTEPIKRGTFYRTQEPRQGF